MSKDYRPTAWLSGGESMNNKWLRQTIQSFKPYAAPNINENIVIDANESPYNIFDFPKVQKPFWPA